MSPSCEHCGGTGYPIRSESEETEILRDTGTGRVLLPWEIRALSVAEMQRRVAAGTITVERRTIQRQAADPRGYCRHCDAGRNREHQELANTPVLPKRTGTRKNQEVERDAS